LEKLVLYQKLNDLADWLFPIVDRFPRAEKFVLCTQIKNSVYTLMRFTIRAQKSRDKLRWLYEVDIELEILRSLVRHAHFRKYLSHKKYEIVSKMLSEIGRILGGLIKISQGVRP